MDCTAVWLADTGQNTNAGKSGPWRMSDQQAQPVTLHGVPIPLAREFKLRVGVRLDPERGTGPVLQERFAHGATILRRVGCLPKFHMREVAIGTLALAKAMYGVDLADVGSRDVARLARRTTPGPGGWGEVCHRVRESQRYTALAALERRRRATFLGGLNCPPWCRLYTTETLQWRMQFVLQCYFFEFRYLFRLVYKCAQLQAKRAKWTIWGMISVKHLTRCALCGIGG